jgi:methyl-accepting chemotaxis protein
LQAVAAATCEVATATGEISFGTTDLSERTEEQAASLEQNVGFGRANRIGGQKQCGEH